MKYNFDEHHNRLEHNSIKWSYLENSKTHKNVLPLWVADMDFKAANEIIEAVNDRALHGIYGYTTIEDDFYNAFIKWFTSRYSREITSENLIYSPGVVMSIILAIKALTNPEDAVVIQSPVYGPFARSIRDHNRLVVENPLINTDGYYTMDMDHLETCFKQGAKLMILCSPHNPIGRVWTGDELKALAVLTSKYNVTIIADEIHSDLVYKPNKHTPFLSFEDIQDQIVTCMSPTKTFNLAGIQASVVITKKQELYNKISEEFNKMDLHISNCFGETAFKAAYNHGGIWLEEVLDYIEENVNYVIDFTKHHIPSIKIRKPQGTYLLWLDCRSLGLSPDDLMSFMVDKAGVQFTEGTFFGTLGQGFMRMNVACPKGILIKAMSQLEAAVNTMLEEK